jgi:hypothetical protein
MRVEDLDKNLHYENVETVKQLIIINVLFFIGTLIVGDPAYKMLAMFFLRMTAFNYGSLFRICLCTVGICIFFQYVCFVFFRIGLGEFWGSKSFYSIFLVV